MKKIGMLGGMSWESTVNYYKLINEGVRERLGGLHSAEILMYSVDFHEIERLQNEGLWGRMGEMLSRSAMKLERAGADFIVICTNTMHKVAPAIEDSVDVPLLHIADATGRAVRRQAIKTVGLLGTAFTMEQEFYKGRLEDVHDLNVITPTKNDRKIVHDVIYKELCMGITRDESRRRYIDIIDDLAERGAEGVILGCTEIGMLVNQEDTKLDLFDTTAIHADAAVEFALED
ncbi:aspartate/glutamate racemase family protein [Limisalsivibrio acetivorans]|uniref:aspartate/glutamate racemase family protein n=1 Tax=Limisalsivibrio acetivorans TaxID=1304888 RepID=UPI0003B5BCCB|nr:aspartate/glutamate racemase family protein [Limisalsivibrio acetivorans]